MKSICAGSLQHLCFLFLSHFFQNYLFVCLFVYCFFSQISLFILILAFSSLSPLLLSIPLFHNLCLEGEVNFCRNFSVRPTWLCLDGFEGCGVAAETRILSRFLLMTPSLLFTSSVSFLAFHFIHFTFITF